MTYNEIFEFIGKIIAVGGGAAVIAYGIFTYLGKKWLDGKFAERLEAFKHQQNLQMEHYKYEINSLFNRVTKIHEKEFEVLPTAWTKLQDALGRVARLTSPIRTYPNLNIMRPQEVEETLVSSELPDSQKDIIRHAEDKNQAYIKAIFWYDLNVAKDCMRDFHNYLLYNKVFLSKEIFDSFTHVDKLLTESLDERELLEQYGDYKRASKVLTEITDNIKPLITKIEQQIQQRLHYTEAE